MRRLRLHTVLAIAMFLSPMSVAIAGLESENYCVSNSVLSSGGAHTTSENYRTDSGLGQSSAMRGYVQAGDVDGNGAVDKRDLGILLSHRNQPADVAYECDLDGDGMITLLDAVKCVLLCTRPRCAVK